MDTDVNSFSVLPETEAKKLKWGGDCEHADRPALFPVHFQLQCLFSIFRTCLQQTFRRPLTLRQQYTIVCVTDTQYALGAPSSVYVTTPFSITPLFRYHFTICVTLSSFTCFLNRFSRIVWFNISKYLKCYNKVVTEVANKI